jgi:hypothetical protein
MIGIGALLLLVLTVGLWFFLAYRSEKEEKPGAVEWVCKNNQWVKKGETDAPKPRHPCPDNVPHVKGPTAPPPN